ncbi:hypothetical protein ACFHWD_03555 [Clostridium sp. MT-14]|uniref:hypothetical protein n=1 Tax=Clostridium sp. MT-14 TaxID=3348360 RepID=UPI0035F390B0
MNEYRADVRLKGVFGIRFICGIRYIEPTTNTEKCFYRWIINGKKCDDLFEFNCKSLEDGKRLCEEKYLEICNKIINIICE